MTTDETTAPTYYGWKITFSDGTIYDAPFVSSVLEAVSQACMNTPHQHWDVIRADKYDNAAEVAAQHKLVTDKLATLGKTVEEIVTSLVQEKCIGNDTPYSNPIYLFLKHTMIDHVIWRAGVKTIAWESAPGSQLHDGQMETPELISLFLRSFFLGKYPELEAQE